MIGGICCVWNGGSSTTQAPLADCVHGDVATAECKCTIKSTRRRLRIFRRLSSINCNVGEICNDDGSCSLPSQEWDLQVGWNFVGLSVRPSNIDDIYSVITDAETVGCIDVECSNGGDRIVLEDGKDAMRYDIPGVEGMPMWYSLSGVTSIPVGTAFYYKTHKNRSMSVTGTLEPSVSYTFAKGYSWSALPNISPASYTGDSENPMSDRLFLENPEFDDRLILDSGKSVQYYNQSGGSWYTEQLPFDIVPGSGFIVHKKHSGESFTVTN